MSEQNALRAGNSTLFFSKIDGSVRSIQFQDMEFQLAPEQFFTLGLHNQERNLEIISSKELKCQIEEETDTTCVFHFTGHSRYPSLTVKVSVRVENDFFHFRPEVRDVPDDLLLEWIDVPQIVVPAGGKIFWPHAEGVLIDRPEEREKSPWSRYHVLGFLKLNEERAYSEGGYYPGVCQMQFLSWEKDGVAFYFGAHDRSHGTKAVEYEPLKDGRNRFSLQTFCGDSAKNYIADFDYVFGAMRGDWRDACAVYRDWIASDPACSAPSELPEMIQESPVIMIYPVRGHGDDKGKMTEGNEYFPYTNAMPVVEKYASLFNSKILSLLMHWEGTAPWAPPYVWPPFGGETMLADYARELHDQGHYLGVYCSGSAWTQKSSIVDYSKERECEENNLRKEMIQGPHGEIEAVICNGETAQRLGYDMCLAQEWPREVLKEELLKMLAVDIDYTQFFDQNLGGAFHTCYAEDHNHPSLPGRWQTVVMKSLLEEMTAILREKGSDMLLGCEAAAADVYRNELVFNDLRGCWNWGRGVPVPGYQFVFHEYVNNFMGNQCGIAEVFDCDASPENLLYRTAFAFSSGDLLSFVLKEAGKIHWGWGALWNMDTEPEQDSIISLIRNLNSARKEYGKFLQFGRMEKTILGIQAEKHILHLSGRDVEDCSVLHSAWTAPDGERAEILTNYLTEKQSVRVMAPAGWTMYVNDKKFDGEYFEIAPLNAICIRLES